MIIANYVPLQSAARRAELLRVRRRRALRDQDRQQRRRQGRRHLPVHVQDRGDEPEHVPLQHRTRSCRSPTRTGTAARRTRWSASTAERARRRRSAGPPVAAVQHRAAVDAELRDAGRRPRSTLCRRRQGVRRPAGRGFYVDLGAIFDLGDPAAVPAAPHDVRAPEHRARRDGGGGELHQGRQRALDRDRGPEDGRSRRAAQNPTDAGAAGIGDRGVDQPRAVRRPACSRPAGPTCRPGRTCRSPGSGTRW